MHGIFVTSYQNRLIIIKVLNYMGIISPLFIKKNLPSINNNLLSIDRFAKLYNKLHKIIMIIEWNKKQFLTSIFLRNVCACALECQGGTRKHCSKKVFYWAEMTRHPSVWLIICLLVSTVSFASLNALHFLLPPPIILCLHLSSFDSYSVLYLSMRYIFSISIAKLKKIDITRTKVSFICNKYPPTVKFGKPKLVHF